MDNAVPVGAGLLAMASSTPRLTSFSRIIVDEHRQQASFFVYTLPIVASGAAIRGLLY
jgi:hypothetical protein